MKNENIRVSEWRITIVEFLGIVAVALLGWGMISLMAIALS